MKAMRFLFRALTAAALVAAAISCGSVVRSSRSPVLVVIDNLQGIRGATALGTPASNLISDVITLVPPLTGVPTVFGDTGTAQLRLVLKDIGLPGAAPTTTS